MEKRGSVESLRCRLFCEAQPVEASAAEGVVPYGVVPLFAEKMKSRAGGNRRLVSG